MASNIRSTTNSGSLGGAVVYETQQAVNEYLQMHFGQPDKVFPYGFGAVEALRFPERLADMATEAVKSSGATRAASGIPADGTALDVGCAVGGSAFALAGRGFAHVDGMDFSNAFVDAAKKMQADGKMAYSATVEGDRKEALEAIVPDDATKGNCAFYQGDACNLETLRDAGSLSKDGYDAVLAANLLCRLPKPRAFLKSCAEWVVRPGGVLVLVTPFSWLEEYTATEDWIGGKDGASSADALAEEMQKMGFVLKSKTEVPFLIREHARKFQYGVSQGTVWQRPEASA